MSLFDRFSLNTGFANIGFRDGKVVVDPNQGLVPPTPTPATPARPYATQAGPLAWIRANPKTAAAIVIGAVAAFLLLRKKA